MGVVVQMKIIRLVLADLLLGLEDVSLGL